MSDTLLPQLKQSLFSTTKALFPDNGIAFGDTNITESDDAYVIIRIIRVTNASSSQENSLLKYSDSMPKTTGHEILVQFSFISSNETAHSDTYDAAADMLTFFVHSLETIPTREFFKVNNLEKVRVSSVRNVAYKRKTIWANFYNIDVTFLYTLKTEQSTVANKMIQI